MIKRKHPRYVRSFVDRHGTTRFYFQRSGGKNIPLPGLPWSPTFMQAYEAALGDRKVAVKTKATGTVDAAVLVYLQSDGFSKGLAKSTRDTRRRILTNFAKEHGDKRTMLMHGQALLNISSWTISGPAAASRKIVTRGDRSIPAPALAGRGSTAKPR